MYEVTYEDLPATLPLTISHFGLLRWRAAFWFLPANDIFVHCPLSVVGLGHGPRDLLPAAVRHDVDFGCIQRPTVFGTVSWRASWVVWAAEEKTRESWTTSEFSGAGMLPNPEPQGFIPVLLCEQNQAEWGRDSHFPTVCLARMPHFPQAIDAHVQTVCLWPGGC